MDMIMIACLSAFSALALFGLREALHIRWKPGLGWSAEREIEGWGGLE